MANFIGRSTPLHLVAIGPGGQLVARPLTLRRSHMGVRASA